MLKYKIKIIFKHAWNWLTNLHNEPENGGRKSHQDPITLWVDSKNTTITVSTKIILYKTNNVIWLIHKPEYLWSSQLLPCPKIDSTVTRNKLRFERRRENNWKDLEHHVVEEHSRQNFGEKQFVLNISHAFDTIKRINIICQSIATFNFTKKLFCRSSSSW